MAYFLSGEWPTFRAARPSSFNYESTRLAQEGASDLAAVNVVVTVAGCLVAGWLGMLTARQVVSAGGWQ